MIVNVVVAMVAAAEAMMGVRRCVGGWTCVLGKPLIEPCEGQSGVRVSETRRERWA
jgi:hypothetical protein